MHLRQPIKKNPNIKINRLTNQLKQRGLIVGCGWGKHPLCHLEQDKGHTEIHPPDSYYTIDLDDNMHPDITMDIGDPDALNVLPISFFDVVFYENFPAKFTKTMLKNTFDILKADSLCLILNSSNSAWGTPSFFHDINDAGFTHIMSAGCSKTHGGFFILFKTNQERPETIFQQISAKYPYISSCIRGNQVTEWFGSARFNINDLRSMETFSKTYERYYISLYKLFSSSLLCLYNDSLLMLDSKDNSVKQLKIYIIENLFEVNNNENILKVINKFYFKLIDYRFSVMCNAWRKLIPKKFIAQFTGFYEELSDNLANQNFKFNSCFWRFESKYYFHVSQSKKHPESYRKIWDKALKQDARGQLGILSLLKDYVAPETGLGDNDFFKRLTAFHFNRSYVEKDSIISLIISVLEKNRFQNPKNAQRFLMAAMHLLGTQGSAYTRIDFMIRKLEELFSESLRIEPQF